MYAMALPRISVVTPSFNQARYIERTIESVLGQEYPDLEYFVMDGGSDDGSAEIIRRYAERLTGWVSEPDAGQAAAIVAGFERSSGEILAWINSDDCYLPGALHAAAAAFEANPRAALIYGDMVFVDSEGGPLALDALPAYRHEDLKRVCVIPQPAAFWRRDAYEAAGGLDTGFQFAFDYDFFLRLAEIGKIVHLPRLMTEFRYHSETKTNRAQDTWAEEDQRLLMRTLGRREWNRADRWRLRWLKARQAGTILMRRARGERFPCLMPVRWHRLSRGRLEAAGARDAQAGQEA